MNTFSVGDLPENKFFEKDALIDEKFIVYPADLPISRTLKAALREWHFDEVLSEGDILETPALIVQSKAQDGGNLGKSEKTRHFSGLALDNKLEAVKSEYIEYLEYAESFYKKYATTHYFNADEVTEKMRDFCLFVRGNKRYVLRLQTDESLPRVKNYLAEHSLKSTVFALAIAIQLNLPPHRMLELALSCFLHEIGMARLPQKILSTSSALSEQEKKAIVAHPVLSYNILQAASFSLSVCLGALEHHERENGTGYPRRLTKDRISNYGKIISVACSYEAATARRPFKEGLDAYSGIVDILKNNGQQYDAAIVRALLASISLYPIGSYVLLSDGKKGQVVDINPKDPKYPIVQVLGEHVSGGKPKIIETAENALHIVRPLAKSEIG